MTKTVVITLLPHFHDNPFAKTALKRSERKKNHRDGHTLGGFQLEGHSLFLNKSLDDMPDTGVARAFLPIRFSVVKVQALMTFNPVQDIARCV